MKRNIPLYLTFISILLVFSGCIDKQTSNIPYVFVNVWIDLNDPEFFDLRAPGNSIALRNQIATSVDGYAGIIVVCAGINEYYAYDQCCTFHPELKHKVIPQGAKGECEDCDSQYFLLDGFGTVLEKPASRPLLRYKVSKSGSKLFISNY